MKKQTQLQYYEFAVLLYNMLYDVCDCVKRIAFVDVLADFKLEFILSEIELHKLLLRSCLEERSFTFLFTTSPELRVLYVGHKRCSSKQNKLIILR